MTIFAEGLLTRMSWTLTYPFLPCCSFSCKATILPLLHSRQITQASNITQNSCLLSKHATAICPSSEPQRQVAINYYELLNPTLTAPPIQHDNGGHHQHIES